MSGGTDSLLPALLAKPSRATLALADGTVFRGFTSGRAATASGEVVFNTSMFGYQEMLTDPSYRGQILVLTTSHVGNVGVNGDDEESRRIWAQALIVPDLTLVPSNWRARGGLDEILDAAGVPVAWGFDTRRLVLHLRDHGALPGVLVCGPEPSEPELAALIAAARGTDGCDLAHEVARSTAEAWDAGPWRRRLESAGAEDGWEAGARSPGPGARSLEAGALSPEPGARVVVIDCGVKHSILRELVAAGAAVEVVPLDAKADAIIGMRPAGVVVSNGPGDPAAVTHVPDTMRALLGKVPLLGICLGHQLLGVALGGKTYKLRFGHHGGNHPVRDEATGAVWITSQNHNYAVDAVSLPAGARVSMTNLTDGSVEGIVAEELRAEGIQFHPEAGPGPHDALGVFSRFLARCREAL